MPTRNRSYFEEKLKNATKDELLDHIFHLQKANASAHVGYWIYDIKLGELYWSEEVFKIHGLDPDDDMPSVDVAINFYHPDDRQSVQECFERAVKEGEPYQFQLRLIRPSGELRYVESKGEMERDSQGNPSRVFGVFRDMTNEKLQQQELIQSEGRFKLAVSAGRIGIWDWDLHKDKIFWAGQSLKILGVQADEMSRSTYLERVHPEDRLLVTSKIEELIDTKKPYELNYRMKHEAGHYIHIQEKGQAVNWDSQGTVTRVVGSAEDVTKTKEIEEDLRRSNKDLERFAFIASHDLREPMRTITNFAKLLKEDGYDDLPENSQKYIDFMADAAARMTNMINDLLTYSRVMRDESEPEELCLTELIEEMRQNLGTLIKEKNVELVLDNPTDAKLKLNRNLFIQLLQNLITNAVKYKHPDRNPVVTVSIKQEEAGVKIAVQDNGMGIKEEHFEKIFDMFSRLSNQKDADSTGMGLATCRRIATSWDGDIGVESTFGEGSSFYVTLPEKVLVTTAEA